MSKVEIAEVMGITAFEVDFLVGVDILCPSYSVEYAEGYFLGFFCFSACFRAHMQIFFDRLALAPQGGMQIDEYLDDFVEHEIPRIIGMESDWSERNEERQSTSRTETDFEEIVLASLRSEFIGLSNRLQVMQLDDDATVYSPLTIRTIVTTRKQT